MSAPIENAAALALSAKERVRKASDDQVSSTEVDAGSISNGRTHYHRIKHGRTGSGSQQQQQHGESAAIRTPSPMERKDLSAGGDAVNASASHSSDAQDTQKGAQHKDQQPKPIEHRCGTFVLPDSFEESKHFYPRVLNAHLHPMVAAFQRLGNTRIALRYCHLHPRADYQTLLNILNTQSQQFVWSGADLFNVTNPAGNRQMVLIENNSCPSGQKSMPMPAEETHSDGYHKLMQQSFLPLVQSRQKEGSLPHGALAVIYDKNDMEALGYAAALADVSKEAGT